MSSGFSSIFKIDGVPILPPLMTAEVRAEAARYREMAMEIERKLKKTQHESVCQLDLQQEEEEQTPNLEAALLTRRESFTLDAPSPGLINLPHSTAPLEEKRADLSKKPTVADSEDETPRPRLIRSNSYTLESPSPLLMKHMHNQSLNIKNSISMGEIEIAATKTHVKRLDFGGGDRTPMRKTAKSGSKTKWVSTKKVSPKPITPVKKHKSPYVSAVSSKKKPKAAKQQVKLVVRRSSLDNQQQNTPVSECQQRIKNMQTEHERRVKELLKRQEEEQLQLQESFRRQQEELVKMLPVPLLDQIHTSTPLLVSPNESTVEEEDPGKPSFRTLNISSKEFVNNNESQSSIGHLSSSQTLFVSSSTSGTSLDFENSDELYRTCENNALSNRASSGDANGNFQFHSMRNYLEAIGQSLQDNELKQLTQVETAFEKPSNERDRLRYHAASLINAHVRGYLTRRLFQTDHVQKMIQVIRDTLLFILDLHHEKTVARQQIRSPADVQLKRTLLQQLTSACYQLHEVFFEISIPQRMEIIRRDRETLRRRLENRPRTASSAGSTKSSTSARRQLSLRKLQMCSLYSVNIEGEPVADGNADDQNVNASESPINADHIPKPKPPATAAASAPPSRSSLRSTSSRTSSPSLSATVVSRLVHQVKKAVVSPNRIHCQQQQTKAMDLRPKTSDAALVGAPYRRTSWEQKYL
ncbi:centriolar coiled-coil protein of 110 kDa [Ochlerotatus camptorhynchus]|uniref:centriolar coiled-coil protein of 110 kDa n=1 Tax=Ochlerotatus camptorhynchus TaxID=644619 RepID=UPI0031D995C9